MRARISGVGCLPLLAGALWMAATGCVRTQTDKIPITTSSAEALQFYVQGRDLSERLQEQESIQFFKKAISIDPAFGIAYLELALVEPTRRGFFEQLDKAMALLDRVSEGERLEILGIRAIADGDPHKQIKLFEQLAHRYPNDERAHNLLATALYSQEDYGRAIGEYEKAIDIAPEFSQPYNQLGYAYKYLGNFDRAQDAFRHYIELIPDDPNPYDSYGELLLKMGRYEQAIEQYQKALSINPNFVSSHIGLATVYNLRGDHEGARNQLGDLYRIARDDGERRQALFAMAVSYIDEGNLEGACLQFKQMYAIAEQIHDASAMSDDLVNMGRCYFEAGRYEEALAKFESARALILVSNLSDEIKANAELTYLYNTARVDTKRGYYSSARGKAQDYLASMTAKNHTVQIRRAHELAACIALEEADYQRALSELAMSSQLNPYNHFRMALAYEATGDVKRARECCRKAAEFHALNSIDYAFVRARADSRLASL